MGPPFFPITPDQLRGEWTFGMVDEGQHDLEGFRRPGPRDPPPRWPRLRLPGERRPQLARPTSPTTARSPSGPGPTGWGPYHEAALALADGVDLLLHDAQYTAAELPARATFGHAAAEYAVALAERAGAKRVALFHHDPLRTDDEVLALAERLRVGARVGVDAAVEQAVIEL